MINLLPPEQKRHTHAGQSNVLLLRYCIASIALGAILSILIMGVYLIMDSSIKESEKIIAETTGRSQSYQEAQQKSNNFKQDLATAKSILDKESNYSKIVLTITQLLPEGIILDSISLTSNNPENPITIQASGRSYDDALHLKTALENSELFDDVHLQSASRDPEREIPISQTYPVTISISIVVSPEIKNQP